MKLSSQDNQYREVDVKGELLVSSMNRISKRIRINEDHESGLAMSHSQRHENHEMGFKENGIKESVGFITKVKESSSAKRKREINLDHSLSELADSSGDFERIQTYQKERTKEDHDQENVCKRRKLESTGSGGTKRKERDVINPFGVKLGSISLGDPSCQEIGANRWKPKKHCDEDDILMLSKMMTRGAGETAAEEIRAIQVLPQPPIHPKFYFDGFTRQELKTWLWHPTDKNREKKWHKARKGHWSIDCDGSFRKRKYGRYGGVIRDDKGGREIFVHGKSPKIASALYHEVEGIYRTVQVAERFGIRKMSIRTDCERAVELLTNPLVQATPKEGRHVWDLVAKLKIHLSRYFMRENGCSVHIRHQHRETNNLADYVAGLYNGPETTPFTIVGSFDETTSYFLARDIAGPPYYWDRDRQKAEKKRLKESLHK